MTSSVEIPSRSTEPSQSSVEPPEGAQKRKGTLLIVDDEEGPRQSLRIIFKDDYETLLAEDGPTAIDLAQKNSVDVALLDIRMAGMSGIEVLERLKFVDPNIEVVMMTAYETTDTIRQALKLRACDYINKPFDVSTIRSAVASAMQRRTLESEIDANSEKLKELLAELQKYKMGEQISQARTDIYASIIHDINGPLTVISGFLQLINQRMGNSARLGPGDLEFVRERLKTITRQVTNCIEISRRYLSLARGAKQELEQVSASQLLHDLNQLVKVHPSLRDNHFSVVSAPEGVGARMNGTDLMQALLNLVVNALQCAAEPHSVQVTAALLQQPLDLGQFKDGPQDRFLNIEQFLNVAPLLALTVRDTGPGIPEDVLPQIFQPYFTTKGPKEGTGLGLSIVHRLIKEGSGAVHVHSQTGKGTSFTVYVPALLFTLG